MCVVVYACVCVRVCLCVCVWGRVRIYWTSYLFLWLKAENAIVCFHTSFRDCFAILLNLSFSMDDRLMVPMDSESDSSMASGSDSSNSSAKGLRNHSSPAAFFLSSAYEEGSTVKVFGSHVRGVDGSLCETRIWKKMDLALGSCKKCRAAEREDPGLSGKEG